ncbi:MAG: hypothetical protein QM702_00185 [Rubrivivax sp.]
MNDSTYLRAVGGRTFVLTVGCGGVCSILLWFGKLDAAAFTTIIVATVGAYIAANAVQRHAEVRADVQKTVAGLQAEASPPSVVEQVPR